MFKKLLLAAAVFAAPLASASGQVFAGNYGSNCSLTDLNVTAVACSGFWTGNYNNSEPPNALSDLQTAGLAPLSAYGPFANVQKVNSGSPINFGTTFYGVTVIGFHWGNFKENDSDVGNVSAFYVFDFGAGGSNPTFQYNTGGFAGVSNAIVYKTGVCTNRDCGGGGNEVPEPSSYALVAAGLLGLGFVSRRRRKDA